MTSSLIFPAIYTQKQPMFILCFQVYIAFYILYRASIYESMAEVEQEYYILTD